MPLTFDAKEELNDDNIVAWSRILSGETQILFFVGPGQSKSQLSFTSFSHYISVRRSEFPSNFILFNYKPKFPGFYMQMVMIYSNTGSIEVYAMVVKEVRMIKSENLWPNVLRTFSRCWSRSEEIERNIESYLDGGSAARSKCKKTYYGKDGSTRHQVLGRERGNRVIIYSLHNVWNQWWEKIQWRVMTVFFVWRGESNDNLQQRTKRRAKRGISMNYWVTVAKGMCPLCF